MSIVSGGGPDNYRYSETRVLNPSEISQKYLVLGQTPIDPAQVSLDVAGGGSQINGTAFEVTAQDGGRRVSWSGKGLDSIISNGDIFRLEYLISM